MEHHADFAVPVTQRLRIETRHDRPGGAGSVAGRAIALGWWVDDAGPRAEPATGTLYLVVDETLPRPVWVAQADVTAVRLED